MLVSISSEPQHDLAVALTALTALADQPVQAAITLAADVPNNITAPPNATVTAFVPRGPILDRAVCAVTHGGMGSTLKALARADARQRAGAIRQHRPLGPRRELRRLSCAGGYAAPVTHNEVCTKPAMIHEATALRLVLVWSVIFRVSLMLV